MKIATFTPDQKVYTCSDPACTFVAITHFQLGTHLKKNPGHRTREQALGYQIRESMRRKKKQGGGVSGSKNNPATTFCTNCGVQAGLDWKFCGGCGVARV